MFDKALTKIIALEGGLKVHKNPTEPQMTYAGIYRKAHPNWNGWKYIDKGQQPPFDFVREFYKTNYWDKLDFIKNIELKIIVFDTSVNIGLIQAIKLLQVALQVIPDGIPGIKTKTALNNIQDYEKLILHYILLRIKYYTNLANKNKNYNIYLKGWINRVFKLVEDI